MFSILSWLDSRSLEHHKRHKYHFAWRACMMGIHISLFRCYRFIMVGKQYIPFETYRNVNVLDMYNIHSFWKEEHFMDKVCSNLWFDHRSVHLDIGGIFFDWHPSNLARDIEHIQPQYQKECCQDKHIFFFIFQRRMFWGILSIFYYHNSKNLDSRTKYIFHFIQMVFRKDIHMLISIY